MKKSFAILIISCLLLSNIFVIASPALRNENDSHILDQSLVMSLSFPQQHEMVFEDTAEGASIGLTDCTYVSVMGDPMLPVKDMLVALPPGCDFDYVEVSGFHPVELQGRFDIKASPRMIPFGVEGVDDDILAGEWSDNHQRVYGSNQAYPDEIVAVKACGTLRKYSYVSLSVCPFQYYPVSGSLWYDDSITITIYYTLSALDNEHIEELKRDMVFDKRASEIFLNYNQIKEWYQPSTQVESASLDSYDYLVITDDEFVDLVTSSDFLAWKTDLGFNVRVLTATDSLITSQAGVDLAEQIRNFLREYYLQWGVKYVLIVGDYMTIPMRYCSPNPYWLEGTVPTDTYYADLSFPDEDSWDSNHDGYYGVYGQDSPDFLADVYVGRIPTSNPSKISYTLDKFLSFEQDTGNWKQHVLQGGAMLFYAIEDHNPDIDHDIDGCSALNAIETDVLGDEWTVSHYSEHEGLSPSVYEWDALNEAAFTADWRTNQYAVVNWAAHGALTSIGRVIWDWDDGDGIPEHDNGELIWGSFLSVYSSLEGDYPSVVFAVSCNVGYPEPTGEGNLGIDLLTKSSFGAAVGICSATRGAAASVDFEEYHAGAEALCYEFNRYMINGPYGVEQLGDALYDSKFYVHDNFGWDHYLEFQNMYVYNLYGDPAMIQLGTTSGAPFTPVITGSAQGTSGEVYGYTIVTNDPTDDQVSYIVDWGDGTVEEWTDFYPSGEQVVLSHSWSRRGTYIIKAKACDTNDDVSDWGILEVSMPQGFRFRYHGFFELLLRFFSSFPLFEKVLNVS